VLYAEPLARAAGTLTRHARQPVHTFDDRLVPRWRRFIVPPAAVPFVPWWVTALDVVCLIVLVMLLRTWVGSDAGITTDPGVPPSLSPWPWLLAALAALLAVRRLSWNIVPWPARVAGWLMSMWNAESMRAAWPPFVTSRLAVLVAGYVAVFTIGFEGRQPWRAIENDWLDLYARWDAGWYFQIASRGYPSQFDPLRESEIAFFPGLPLLMRGGSLLLDVSPWLAGILVIVVAFLWGLTYLYRLARLDLPPDQAQASLIFLAFYPFAFCYSAILTESVFLLAAVGAFYYFRRDALWKAGLFGLLAGLLRPNGFLLSVPLGLIALIPFARSRGWLPGRPTSAEIAWPALARQLAAASLPIVGMAAYAGYVGSITGNPLSWIDAQQAWGRATAEGLNVAEARRAMIESQGLSSYARSYTVEILEAAAAVFALGAVWPIVRRFGLPYGVFVLLCVVPPLVSMGSVSLGRYTAPLFPIFLWLGTAVAPERRPYWFALFAAGQALLAVLFFTWRPPY
jgi:MYXO-CTERM domain-containing protein